ncbi:MAG: baseplate J/gp47 family protein [Bacillota bacterium]
MAASKRVLKVKGRKRIVVGRREPQRGGHGAFPPGFTSMTALAAFLILGTFYTLWPRVTVVVSPRVSAVRTKALIHASTSTDKVDVEGGRIPAQVVEDVFEASATVPTSGSVSVGVTKARGSVVFINEGSKATTVPGGTLLATPGGARFVTLASVVVPASRVKYFMKQAVGIDAGMAEVNVEAEEPGARGNVAAGRITVMVEKRISGLKVMNPEPFSGGQDKITPVVAESDFEVARKRLKAEALKASSRVLLEKALGDGFVPKETIVVDQEEPVFNEAPLAPASELRASCRVHARALAISDADVSKVASGQFALALAGGARVISPEVKVEVVESKKVDADNAVIEALASGVVVTHIEPTALSRALAGKALGEARSILAAAPEISSFSISPEKGDAETLPRFWRWIRVVVAPCEE